MDRRIIPFTRRRTGDDSVTFAVSRAAHQFADANDPGSISEPRALVLASPQIERVEQAAKELRESLKIAFYISQVRKPGDEAEASGEYHLMVSAEAKKQFSAEIDAIIKRVVPDSAFREKQPDDYAERRRREAELDRREAALDRRMKDLEVGFSVLNSEIDANAVAGTRLTPRQLADRAQLRVTEAKDRGEFLSYTSAVVQVLDACKHRGTAGKSLPANVIARRASYHVFRCGLRGRTMNYSEAVAEVIEAADQEAVSFSESGTLGRSDVVDADSSDWIVPPKGRGWR